MSVTEGMAALVTAQAVAEADRLYPGGPWCPPAQFLAWTADAEHYLPLVREVEHAARIFFPERRVQVSVQWLRRIVSSAAGGWKGKEHDAWIQPCLADPALKPWTRATNVAVSQSVLDALARIGCVEGVGVGHLFTAADLALNGPKPWAGYTKAMGLAIHDDTFGAQPVLSLPSFTWQRYLVDDAMRRFRGLGGTALPPWTARPPLEDLRGELLAAGLAAFLMTLPRPLPSLSTPVAAWLEGNLDLAATRPVRPPEARLRELAARMLIEVPGFPAPTWPEPLASVPDIADAMWNHVEDALDMSQPPVTYPRKVAAPPGLGAYPTAAARPGDHAAARQHLRNPGTADGAHKRLTGYVSDLAVTYPLAHFHQLPEDLPTAIPVPRVRSKANQLVIMHVAVAPSLQIIENTWATEDNESHIGVGDDGTVWQWVDLEHVARANGAANGRAISVETTNPPIPGNKDGLVPEWTRGQIDALRRLTAWCCLRYDIPARVPAGASPGASGLALHVFGVNQTAAGVANWRRWLDLGAADPPWELTPQGGQRVPAEVWSAVVGKPCPGPVRTYQFLVSTGGTLLRLPDPADDLDDHRAVVDVPSPFPDSGLATLVHDDVEARVLFDWPDPPAG